MSDFIREHLEQAILGLLRELFTTFGIKFSIIKDCFAIKTLFNLSLFLYSFISIVIFFQVFMLTHVVQIKFWNCDIQYDQRLIPNLGLGKTLIMLDQFMIQTCINFAYVYALDFSLVHHMFFESLERGLQNRF